MGIQINDLEEGVNILQALKSEKFNKIIKSMMFGNFRIDWNNFKTFKRDWWKEYVIVENCPVIYNRSNYGSDKKYISNNEPNIEENTLDEATLKQMTIPILKTYIKEHKLKIKLSQRKADLVKAILNVSTLVIRLI